MTIYADTSWWIASKCRDDLNNASAVAFFEREAESTIVWTPWHRIEVFNALRQAEYTKLLKAGEARQLISRLEQEIRIGYWQHVEFDWTDAVRTACELSAEHSLRRGVRGMDLFHVAIAIEVAADGFLSFDRQQNSLAHAVGLHLPRLDRRKSRR